MKVKIAEKMMRNEQAGKQLNTFRRTKSLYWFFVTAMWVLIVVFFVLFTGKNHNGQDEVFFSEAADYMADYFNVAKYSADGDPYFYESDAEENLSESETEELESEAAGEEESGSAEQAYFPLTYVIFHFLSRLATYEDADVALLAADANVLISDASDTALSGMELITASIFMALMVLLLFWELNELSELSSFKRLLLLLSLFLSGISLFSFERGNIVYLAAVCTVFYLACYRSENRVIRELSFVSLAIAAALKGYPAILGILLLYEKRYKEAGRTILYGILFAIGPFALTGGLASIPRWYENLQANMEAYSYGKFARFGYLYYLSWFLDGNMEEAALAMLNQALGIVTWILAIAAILSCPFQRIAWKKYLTLLSLIILLPSNSAFYGGLYLFIVIVMFFNEKEHTGRDGIYVLLFVILLNPVQITVNDISISQICTNAAQYLLFFLVLGENLYAALRSLRMKGSQEISETTAI